MDPARIHDAFEAGTDVVLVRAATGSGKSLVARVIAANRSVAALTLASFVQTGGSNVFGQRYVVVIDEARGLGNWVEMYATIELGPSTVSFRDRGTRFAMLSATILDTDAFWAGVGLEPADLALVEVPVRGRGPAFRARA